MTTKKTATSKPVKKRIDVFTAVYFGENEQRFNVGEECLIEDTDELERLTEIGVIKSTYRVV